MLNCSLSNSLYKNRFWMVLNITDAPHFLFTFWQWGLSINESVGKLWLQLQNKLPWRKTYFNKKIWNKDRKSKKKSKKWLKWKSFAEDKTCARKMRTTQLAVALLTLVLVSGLKTAAEYQVRPPKTAYKLRKRKR